MAARRQVVWTRGAQRELGEAVEYIAQDSTEAALHFLDDALSAARSLESLALRGRAVPEINDPALREILVHRYRLMYLVLPDSVEILAFIHSARDFERWRREE
jgi:plasmid stabilization system protein ParE